MFVLVDLRWLNKQNPFPMDFHQDHFSAFSSHIKMTDIIYLFINVWLLINCINLANLNNILIYKN